MKVQNQIRNCVGILTGLMIIMAVACKKEEDDDSGFSRQVPTLTTTSVSNVAAESAISGGTITADGDAVITARGVCWGEDPMPTVGNNDQTSDGSGNGSFISSINGLEPNTKYYVRAYAINAVGVGYGNVWSFTTSAPVPVNPPCSPTANRVRFNAQNINYTSVMATTSGLSMGDYGLVANASNSDLRIEFGEAPVTGKYITASTTSFNGGKRQCYVNGVFGSTMTYPYVASEGDTVYVTKIGEDKYSMTFCDLYFTSPSTSTTFNTDGNLTTP